MYIRLQVQAIGHKRVKCSTEDIINDNKRS